MEKHKLVAIVVLFLAVGFAAFFSVNSRSDVTQTEDQFIEFSPAQNMPLGDIPAAKATRTLVIGGEETADLSIDIVKKEIDGNVHRMYGYNGMIPGPKIEVSKDSAVSVKVTNNIDMPTTVHWHGLRLENKFDGVPGATQKEILPGESYEYHLTFPDEGIFWYHTHVREDVQQDLGLYGMIVVTQNDANYFNDVNKEEILILDDLLLRNRMIVPYGRDYANFAIMGRFGNTILVNGESNYSLSANKGDVIRFYLANVANARPFNVSFSGAKMKLIGSDLSKYEEERFVDSVIIAPAERYIVEVYFDREGEYTIESRTSEGVRTLGTVSVLAKRTPEDHSAGFANVKKNEDVVEDIEMYRQYFSLEPKYTFDLTLRIDGAVMMNDNGHGGHGSQMMGVVPIEWEDTMPGMNAISTSKDVHWIIKDRKTGKENMDFMGMAKVGDKIKIRLFNDQHSLHPMQHPIHLHGQRFLVLSRNNVQNDNLVWKDTVLVTPGETVDILVDVTNPGEWMLHCHIAEHLTSGMMTSIMVEE